MDNSGTYQNDTIRAKNVLLLDINQLKPKGLLLERSKILVETPISDSSRIQLDSTKEEQPKPPTLAQIRYWRWQRENSLLIDGSRYIKPKNEVKLVSTIKEESGKIGLPMYEISRKNTDWITGIILLSFVLLATVRTAYSKYMVNLFQSLVMYSTSFRLFREKNYPILHGAFRLEAFFYINFSLFLYQAVHYFQLPLSHKNLTFYAVILIGVFLYFFIKKIVYSIVGSILEVDSETKEYLFNMDNFNRTLGIVLFPIAVLINYYPSETPLFVVVLGIIAIGVFYVFLLQRGVYIFLRKQFSIFYLFLYLCTLEFLPLFLIYKVVVL